MFYRDTWLEVDLDAYAYNIRYLLKHTQKQMIAVVKANGYGMTALVAAKEAMAAGASMVAVANFDEALDLRNRGFCDDILVLGVTRPDSVLAAKKNNIILTMPSLTWAKSVAQSGISGLRLHLKIETGMNRLGLESPKEAQAALVVLKDQSVEGIFTHYSSSDDANNDYNDLQYNRFVKVLKSLDHPFQWIHCSNSDAALHYKEEHTNAFRPGCALLGVPAAPSELKLVYGFYTKINHLKQLEAGQAISYGREYTTQAKEWIATVPVGYADGLRRANSGYEVYISGQRYPFVGRICMDQAMIRLDSFLPLGTTVELFGPHIPIQEMAERLKTIPLDIYTSISDRVTRVYRKHGEVDQIINPRFDFPI
ncbi:MAG: alanine racemase [Erysipelotrichaceae bacterium]|jgi:alanine racemase|nr:alanine racemase [Erysipelotrichaceae bacterium]